MNKRRIREENISLFKYDATEIFSYKPNIL